MDTPRNDTHLLWTELDREVALTTPVFSILRSRRKSADGRLADYFILDSPDWANIVALASNNRGQTCFVMVRQYRHGSRQVSIEFPGGVVDPGEDPQTAVRRELREETGYSGEVIELLGSVNPNPALMGNRCYTYFCPAADRIHADQDLDANEIIDVELVPVEDLVHGRHSGSFDHAMMHVALDFYLRLRGANQMEKER